MPDVEYHTDEDVDRLEEATERWMADRELLLRGETALKEKDPWYLTTHIGQLCKLADEYALTGHKDLTSVEANIRKLSDHVDRLREYNRREKG